MNAVPLLRSAVGLGVPVVCLTAAIVGGSCAGAPPGAALASWDAGSVEPAELDAMIRGLPPSRRQPAAGQSLEDWIEARLADLAVGEILRRRAADEETGRLPELELRIRYEASQEVGRAYLAERCGVDAIEEGRLVEAYREAYPREAEEWILVRHIYKRSLPDDPPEERAAARGSLERLRSELEAGASFVELARLHSDSETAGDGGLIGRLSRRAPIEPKVREAAWALRDGEIGEVVEVSNGFHLLLREESGVVERPSFEEVKEELARVESLRRRDACGRQILAELGEATPVSVDREALLDPDDESRVALRVGEEEFTARELAGLTEDFSPLMLTSRPGELLRHFSEAALLVRAALAEDAASADRFARAKQRIGRRLANERQWRRERRRVVEERTEAELRAYYDRHRDRFRTDLELDVGLITVGGEGRPGRRPAMERALGLRRRLEEGESFERLAAELSEHGSRQDAGRLGSLPLPRLRVILGSRGAASVGELAVGEISQPIEIQGPPLSSFALIKLYGRTEPRPRSYDEARDDVVSTLSRENVQQLDREVRERLLAEEGFTLHPEAIEAYVAGLRG